MKTINREMISFNGFTKAACEQLFEQCDNEDKQVHRAQELEALALHRIAREVLACRSCRREAAFTCKRMACPGCCGWRSKRNFRRVLRVLKKMRNPQLLLLTWRSESLNDARETVQKLRRGIVGIFRTEAMAGVEAAIGSIELKLTDDGRRWNAHCHLVVDQPEGDLKTGEAATWWRKLTSIQTPKGRRVSRGTLSYDGAVADVEKTAAYITKQVGWSPAPGALPGGPSLSTESRLVLLETMWTALRRVHLVVGWRLRGQVTKSLRVTPTAPALKSSVRRSSRRTSVATRKPVQERVPLPRRPSGGRRPRTRPNKRENGQRKTNRR